MQYAWCDHFGITLAWEFPRGSRFEVFVPCHKSSNVALRRRRSVISNEWTKTHGRVNRLSDTINCCYLSRHWDNSDQSTLPPLTNTPDIPWIDLHNHQHIHMRSHIRKSISCILITDWLLILYYRLVSLVSSVKLVLSLSSLCSLLISKCILSGSLNQHQ